MPADQLTASSRPGIGVLVAEEEAAIRHLLQTGLSYNGFTVWTASDGQEALDLFRQHSASIQVALLDLHMPRLNGPATLLALQVLRPDLVCCFMSGGTEEYTEQDLLELGAARVFHKPFSLAELVAVLHQLSGLPERRTELRLLRPLPL